MSRRAAGLVLSVALLVLVGGGAWWWWASHPRRPGAPPALAPIVVGPPATFNAELYFPGGQGLRAETRKLVAADTAKERIKKIVQALLAGPTAAGLVRPFPQGVELGAVTLTPEGVAYVDLRWLDHPDPPAGGSEAEMQAIYSIVNSVALNVPEARRVALLWNGSQRESFAGHLDTGQALSPDRSLLGL